MKTLKISEAREGMRVRLTNPSPYYTIDSSNPKVDTIYECEGTIVGVGNRIKVDWDNGRYNSYVDNELSEVTDTKVTGTNKCKSIW